VGVLVSISSSLARSASLQGRRLTAIPSPRLSNASGARGAAHGGYADVVAAGDLAHWLTVAVAARIASRRRCLAIFGFASIFTPAHIEYLTAPGAKGRPSCHARLGQRLAYDFGHMVLAGIRRCYNYLHNTTPRIS
jgi:hypothetical protein